MSLSRTALRLAVVEALSPYAQHVAAEPVWPTFAGVRVYDSQIGPVDVSGDDMLPVIIVSVDAAKTDPHGSAQDVTVSGDGKETATLGFEIEVPVAQLGEDGSTVYAVGPTDAAAKAFLEMIEDQILQRIGDARMDGALRHVLDAVMEIDSQPFSDPDAGILLSATRLELKCQIRQRASWPAPPQTGLARLPDPLRSVAQALPAQSYGGLIAAGIAELLGNPALFPALNDLRLAANLARTAQDSPAAATDATQTPPAGDIGGRVNF